MRCFPLWTGKKQLVYNLLYNQRNNDTIDRPLDPASELQQFFFLSHRWFMNVAFSLIGLSGPTVGEKTLFIRSSVCGSLIDWDDHQVRIINLIHCRIDRLLPIVASKYFCCYVSVSSTALSLLLFSFCCCCSVLFQGTGGKHTYDFHTATTLSLPTSIMCEILRHVGSNVPF